MVIDVLTQIKSSNMDKTFSYKVPSKLEKMVQIGSRVTIPFGHQTLEGFVINYNLNKEFDYELKEIIDVIDLEPVLNYELLELGNYISKKTICTRTSIYQAMLPAALKAKKGFVIPKRYITYLSLNSNTYLKGSDKQKEIISLLTKNQYIKKEVANKISVSATKTLINKKIIVESRKEVYRLDDSKEKEVSKIILNSEQLKVLKEIKSKLSTFAPFLLHGVTGSGKTEVYMHLIDEVLKSGREAIVLVPEISLTPQLVATFKKHFGKGIAILHSGLSNGEKFDEWRKIVRKEVSIVIGARSAIFAPLTNLGIIIIDEEHSTTYKQETNPYYNAIDVALKRAKTYNCPIVLGSATPSIESYTRALVGTYKLLTMKKRVNNNMPNIKLVPMQPEIKAGYNIFSRELMDMINKRLACKEQVIILLNRRGYTTVLTCKDCGYTDKCPNCDIPLTYHKSINGSKCHYCGYTRAISSICPECHSKNISMFGLGTEKLEEIINNLFKARTVRMDVDTTSKKGSHKKIIDDFLNHKYDILVGTQMISKGLDFGNVTLVGVINGDSGLNIPDFRSAERTFSLLSQVAGRSGRANKTGEVIIQGFNMDHYSIKAAAASDYEGFYKEELRIRKAMKYPPYYNLCLIKIQSRDYNLGNKEANKITAYLRSKSKNTIILGPSSASMPKINNVYYLQIIIKYKNIKDIYEHLSFINNHYKSINKVTVGIDINPIRI